jgi:hypothetical protein
MTALASVTMVMQTSTVWTAAAAVEATSAPRSANGRATSTSRFHTTVGIPARRAERAIP